jgi:Outer membrane protein beta-barrel domain
MKKYTLKLTALFVLVVTSLSAYCQKSFQIGLRYIPTITTLFNKDDKAAGAELNKEYTRSLITAGFALEYACSKTAGFEVDILYSRQGQEYSGTNMQSGSTTAYNRVVAIQAMLNNAATTGTYQAKAELNCIKIPILFKLSTVNTKSMYYTLSFGPQINYLSDAVYELNKNDVELPGSGITPIDAYKKVTVDGVVAFGVAFNVSQHFVFSAQARFDYGFEDVEKKDVTYNNTAYYPAGRSSTHNGTAGLVFGVSYKL